ncbi:hypothetical protein PIB30_089969 [Stylosanthes scabra]|uniref:Uncharacterized protein n=1 Tax=Stylosanthes scabra TaxID=79078 RepID=A0ABU6WV90_9FABA|nr:hypothetical protein [Stylosanthes scabra]
MNLEKTRVTSRIASCDPASLSYIVSEPLPTENPVVGILTPYLFNCFSDCRFTIWKIIEATVHIRVIEVLRCVGMSLGRVWRNRSVLSYVVSNVLYLREGQKSGRDNLALAKRVRGTSNAHQG